jgi:DNA polymerase I-like protein with 3'-5' exonuclease and polymerase domains
MTHIFTAEEAARSWGATRGRAYNAFDVTGTRAVLDVLKPRLDPSTGLTYAFERACVSPAFAMMRRGILIDEFQRDKAVKECRADLARLEKEVNKHPTVAKLWDGKELNTGKGVHKCKKPTRKDGHHKWQPGVPDAERTCVDCGAPRFVKKPFNPGSHDQCARLFHDLLKIPPQRNKSGEFAVDAFVVEKIGRKWPEHYDLCTLILEARGMSKQIGFLKARLTKDGRFPSTFNVGAAWTGRWSGSKNPHQEGSNPQNISERHRRIFIADPGMEMFYADLEQAESRCVAYISGDEEYILAHLSGDVHTYVCRMLWPGLPWTGDLKADKKIAKQNPPWDLAPGHSYRFQSKRCQHGSNYGLTPMGISSIAHIPLREAEAMYERYFGNFPGIKVWQHKIKAMVQDQEPLVNPLGRRVRLFGRPWDPHTYKQGLSFIPQSAVADILNLSLWRIWKLCDPGLVWLQAQVHDAILGEWRKEAREEAAKAVSELMQVPVPINGRVMTIPVEIKAGQNWGNKNEKPEDGPLNPLGMEVVRL